MLREIPCFFAGEAEEDVKAIDRSTLEVEDQQVETEPVRFNDERSALSSTNPCRGVNLILLVRVQNDVVLARHRIIRRSQTIEQRSIDVFVEFLPMGFQDNITLHSSSLMFQLSWRFLMPWHHWKANSGGGSSSLSTGWMEEGNHRRLSASSPSSGSSSREKHR